MTLKHVVKDIKSEILEKFIAELITELQQQGFTYAVSILAMSSSRQMPEVAKADSVEER